LQRFGTVPLGNSGYLLPSTPGNEERFQRLATSIRKVWERCLGGPREYEELIREIEKLIATPNQQEFSIHGKDNSHLLGHFEIFGMHSSL
jgi:hypothetical protein